MIIWYIVAIDTSCLLMVGILWHFFIQTVALERRLHSPEYEARRAMQAQQLHQKAMADVKRIQDDLHRTLEDIHKKSYDFSYTTTVYKTRRAARKYVKRKRGMYDFFEDYD